jgi:hypothetical protein
MSKDFSQEFNKFLERLQRKENFAFARFSDGELFVLKNQKVVLAENYFITGDRVGGGQYPAEEQKEFIPAHHSFYRDRLVDSLQFNMEGYYKGICTRSDVSTEDFQWQLGLHGTTDLDHLTFSNVLINNNYSRFVEEIVPLLSDREVVYVVNEAADLAGLPFEVKKDFRVGSNCMVNNYDTVEKVKSYISDNNLKDHVILCSAASLSNFIVHQCYEMNQDNTYLDIGSTLNPYLSLEGWKYTRGYLTHYWMNSGSPYGTQVDIW